MAAGKPSDKYDVIIVGGGIGGLYTAWRLSNSTNLKVLVLEATNRFGGRFMTCQMPGGFSADMGAMRYSPGCHPLLQELIDQLGVTVQPMDQVGGSTKKNKFKFFLRNKQINTLEEFQEMYSIDDKDLPNFLAVNQYYFSDHPQGFDLERPEDGNFSHAVFKPTGQMAKDMSVSQYLLHSNNAEALNLSWSFYPPANWQVAVAEGEHLLIARYWKSVYFVDGGYEAIITAIASALDLSENVQMKRNHKVQSVEEEEDGFLLTSAGNGENIEYRCRKVIYACSMVGLTNIVFEGNRCRQTKLQKLTNQVSLQQAFKIFLTYTRPWWEDYGIYQGIIMTDLPIRCCMTFGDKGKSGSFATLLAAFPHVGSMEFFQGLDLDIHERFVNTEGQISREMTPSKLLVENVHNQLKKMMGCPELMEKPVCAAKYLWGIGEIAAMSYQPNIGVDSNQLHWDSLKPFDDADIFITGDTFPAWDKKGFHTGFSEGSLLTSERILVNHFGLEPFMEGLCLQNPWLPKESNNQ